MNHYEIGVAIEEAGKAIKNMPLSIMQNATDDVESKYKEMINAVTKVQEFSQKCIADLKALDEKHLDACDEICKSIKERNEKLRAAMLEISERDLYLVRSIADALATLRQINPNDLDVLMKAIQISKGGRQNEYS